MPIPSSALTLTSFVLAFYDKTFPEDISKIIIPMILILSYLMVSNIRYDSFPKLKWTSIKEKPINILFVIAALVLILFAYTKGLFFIFVFMILFGIFRHIYKWFMTKESD